MSLRTRTGREAEVVEKIKTDGGFSIFWATESMKRAHAIARLEAANRIVRTGGDYPWCAYRLSEAPPP